MQSIFFKVTLVINAIRISQLSVSFLDTFTQHAFKMSLIMICLDDKGAFIIFDGIGLIIDQKLFI